MLENENKRDAQILDVLGLERDELPNAAHGARMVIALMAITKCTPDPENFEGAAMEYLSSIGRDVAYAGACLYLCNTELGRQHSKAVDAGDVNLGCSITEAMGDCMGLMELLDS